MPKQLIGNYLRTHRRKAGLSQRELGAILGYKRQGQVSRHERSKTVPPLLSAIGYAVVFGTPIHGLFPGLHTTVADAVAGNLAAFESDLQTRSGTQPQGR